MTHELQPFEYIFLKRRDEIIRLVEVSSFAMASMAGLSKAEQVLNSPADKIDQAKRIEDAAAVETRAGYPLLHGAATVLLWGALETAIRDMVVRWMDRNPEALQVPELKKIRVPVADYESLRGEDRARYLLGILEREWGAALKPGVGRFRCLLKPFGINPRRDDNVVRSLNEMAAIRNVIVHRASTVDTRLIELCPWLGYREGDTVTVSGPAIRRYIHASTEYVVAIINAVRVVKGDTEIGGPRDANDSEYSLG